MPRLPKRFQGAIHAWTSPVELEVCRRTPVLDHADEVLYYAGREKVAELLERRDVGVLGTRTKIVALRLQGPDPGPGTGSHPRPGLGSPHIRDNYYNTSGTWHLDRIPSHLRPDFERVLASCSSTAA